MLNNENKGGFSLIELLVVIAIIAMLIAILLPFVMLIRRRFDRMICKNNLRQIAFACQMYLDSNGGKFYHTLAK